MVNNLEMDLMTGELCFIVAEVSIERSPLPLRSSSSKLIDRVWIFVETRGSGFPDPGVVVSFPAVPVERTRFLSALARFVLNFF